jgi:septal ring factor EnvC (AmiA/AmiB activator)
MRLLSTLALAAVVVPAGLFLVAGRPLGEFLGLSRASAQVAVDRALAEVPTEVRDQKLDNDVEQQRHQLIDHQVALNLSRREVQKLETQIAELTQNSARRQRLLSEAYPVLQAAMADGQTQVQFAGASRSLADFQSEIDQLLAAEEREARQLEIRRAGLEKLTGSVTQGERALTEMRDSLLALEQEIDLLRARREQARLEGQTLELVGAVSGAGLPAEGQLGHEAERLRGEVDRLEAGNEALREALPAAPHSNRVAGDWERLERLKAFSPTAAPSGAAAGPVEESAAKPATEPAAAPAVGSAAAPPTAEASGGFDPNVSPIGV